MAKTILIVEDEEAVRELEKFILEQQGYNVMEARDGLEGLAKAEFRKPDAHEMFDDTLGPDNVIMKPFEADTLLGRIRDHIGDPE